MIILKNETFKNNLLYIFVFWMLYVSDSMLFALNNNRVLMSYAGISLLIIGALLALYLLSKRKIEADLMWMIGVSMFLVLSGLFNSGTMGMATKRIATLCVGYFVAKKVNTRKVVDTFCNIMVFIATVSLLGFAFADFFCSFGFLPHIFTSTRQMESVSLFFTNIPINSWNRIRNWGPFWEPGAYQAFLNLALIFTIFLRSKHYRWWWLHALILIVTVITTLSTTGYVALFAIYVAYVLDGKQAKRRIQFSKIFILLLGVIVLAFILGESGLYESVVVQKLSNEESSRFQFVIYGIKAFFDNPIFGNGASLAKNIETMAGYNISFTNSIVANFAIFGIVPGIYVLVRYVKTSLSFKGIVSVGAAMSLGIAIFALLFGEYFMYSPTFAWLLYIDYTSYNQVANDIV